MRGRAAHQRHTAAARRTVKVEPTPDTASTRASQTKIQVVCVRIFIWCAVFVTNHSRNGSPAHTEAEPLLVRCPLPVSPVLLTNSETPYNTSQSTRAVTNQRPERSPPCGLSTIIMQPTHGVCLLSLCLSSCGENVHSTTALLTDLSHPTSTICMHPSKPQSGFVNPLSSQRTVDVSVRAHSP